MDFLKKGWYFLKGSEYDQNMMVVIVSDDVNNQFGKDNPSYSFIIIDQKSKKLVE